LYVSKNICGQNKYSDTSVWFRRQVFGDYKLVCSLSTFRCDGNQIRVNVWNQLRQRHSSYKPTGVFVKNVQHNNICVLTKNVFMWLFPSSPVLCVRYMRRHACFWNATYLFWSGWPSFVSLTEKRLQSYLEHWNTKQKELSHIYLNAFIQKNVFIMCFLSYLNMLFICTSKPLFRTHLYSLCHK